MQKPAPAATAGMPWVIVEIAKQPFALPAQVLRQIIGMPEVAAVPSAPEYVRGVIHVRGRVIPLVDLRRRMGMSSALGEVETFCRLMDEREADHRRWLEELRACVAGKREFKLATDPHACAFGRWYDHYEAEDPWTAALLRRFDAPHKHLHSLALAIKECEDRGESRQAADLLENTGAATLDTMIGLFAELRQMVRERRREVVAVLDVANRPLAATLDGAVAVEKLTVEDLPPGTGQGGRMQRRLGRRNKNDELVLIIEPEEILERECIDSILSQASAAAD